MTDKYDEYGDKPRSLGYRPSQHIPKQGERSTRAARIDTGHTDGDMQHDYGGRQQAVKRHKSIADGLVTLFIAVIILMIGLGVMNIYVSGYGRPDVDAQQQQDVNESPVTSFDHVHRAD